MRTQPENVLDSFDEDAIWSHSLLNPYLRPATNGRCRLLFLPRVFCLSQNKPLPSRVPRPTRHRPAPENAKDTAFPFTIRRDGRRGRPAISTLYGSAGPPVHDKRKPRCAPPPYLHGSRRVDKRPARCDHRSRVKRLPDTTLIGDLQGRRVDCDIIANLPRKD